MVDAMGTIIEAMVAEPSQEKLDKILKDKQENIFSISDIEWKPHSAGIGGERAVIKFDNGYQASIVRGGRFYTDNGTHEIAVLDKNGAITYDTPITDNVLGYLSDEQVEQAFKDISELDKLTD